MLQAIFRLLSTLAIHSFAMSLSTHPFSHNHHKYVSTLFCSFQSLQFLQNQGVDSIPLHAARYAIRLVRDRVTPDVRSPSSSAARPAFDSEDCSISPPVAVLTECSWLTLLFFIYRSPRPQRINSRQPNQRIELTESGAFIVI